MVDTIREQILTNWQTKLQTILVENGYNRDFGLEIYRSFLPPVDFKYLPAIGFLPLAEESTNFHGYHQKFDLQIQVQGVEEFGTIKPGQMTEIIYADIVEAILGNVWTLGFDSGGTYKATVGNYIVGQASGAVGYITGVSLSSGAWAGDDAAGTFNLRRVVGEFENNEALDIGSNDDVATVDGTQSAQNALLTTTGGLADGIIVVSAEPQFPNADQSSTGIGVVFGIDYKRVAGNPYSQTN